MEPDPEVDYDPSDFLVNKPRAVSVNAEMDLPENRGEPQDLSLSDLHGAATAIQDDLAVSESDEEMQQVVKSEIEVDEGELWF